MPDRPTQTTPDAEPRDADRDAPPDADQTQAFAASLRSLSGLFLRVAAQRSAAHAAFSKQDLIALGVLAERGPSRMGDLADALGVGQSAVTPLVDRLEAAGAARRRRSDADRRVWLAELTPEGDAIAQAEDEAYQAVAASMLAPLSPDDRRALIGLLARIQPTG